MAELRVLPRTGPDATTLLERWRHPPHIDPAGLRRDVDEIIDQSLSRSSHAVSSDFVPLAFDAAATAIANGLALYTTNPSNFEANVASTCGPCRTRTLR